MKGKLVVGWVIILSLIAGIRSEAQTTVSPEKYYAFSIYNFSRYVEWPANYQNQELTIAVVGTEDVYNELVRVTANRKHGQYPIRVKFYKKYSDVNEFNHIVFLSSLYSGKISDMKARGSCEHTLFITEREGMGRFGSAISFFVAENGTIEFEITKQNFQSQQLAVSSQLMTLAGKVN